jgi:large conductance mechanosensitive channel
VDDVVMPILGMIIGNDSFENFKFVISPAVGDNPESAIYYGTFIQNVVNFLLISFVVFCMVKAINKLHKKPEPAPEEPAAPTEVEINNELLKANTKVLEEIRDELKKKK